MIVICGEALVDLTGSRFDQAEAYVPKLGGGPYNIAIGLGRLGAPVGYLGRISRDHFGEQLRARLLASGVNPTYLREGPELTTGLCASRARPRTGVRLLCQWHR